MQKSELDNANPTIRDVSQLPSRRGKQAPLRRGPESKYDDLIFGKKQGSLGIFRNVSSWPSDDEDEEDYADGFTEEPIDEQEIYGMQPSYCNLHEPGMEVRWLYFVSSPQVLPPPTHDAVLIHALFLRQSLSKIIQLTSQTCQT